MTGGQESPYSAFPVTVLFLLHLDRLCLSKRHLLRGGKAAGCQEGDLCKVSGHSTEVLGLRVSVRSC